MTAASVQALVSSYSVSNITASAENVTRTEAWESILKYCGSCVTFIHSSPTRYIVESRRGEARHLSIHLILKIFMYKK